MALENMISDTARIREDVKLGEGTKVWNYANLYGCQIGRDCIIGSYVEIQDNARVGDDVHINSHSLICSLVTIEDHAWLGHHVVTINDLYPPSKKRTGSESAWKPTLIREGAVIGSNATLLPVTVGRYAEVGAGSVVTKDVPDYAVVVGNPARIIRIKTPKADQTGSS